MRTRKLPSTRKRAAVVADPREAHGLFAAMRRFLEHRAVLGATDAGLRTAESKIRAFADWADARNVTHPEHVTLAVLERYQRWLYYYRKKNGAPLSLSSQNAMLTPLRGFFKWLTRSGQIPANPAAELEMAKSLRRLPRHVLTVNEVEQVLAGADTNTPVGLRDRAIMEVLYSTGMRRMEIAKLGIGDIDMERGVVQIREGKGRKDRIVPIGERALHWVAHYLAEGREQLAWNQHDATVFLSIEGAPMSLDWLSASIGRYVKRAEIGKLGGCHLFRHTMATLMLEGGADIRFIQAMLGHDKLETTQIYTQVAIKQLQLVHARTHPGAHTRTRSAQANAGEPEHQAVQPNAADTLFDALDAEFTAEGE